MSLVVVPGRPEFFGEYESWCKRRQRAMTPMFVDAEEHLWVWSRDHGLVLGCALFVSSAYVTADELVSNPEAPAPVVHAALGTLIRVWVGYCTTRNRYPMAHVRARGVALVLKRMGFEVVPNLTMVRNPFVEVALRKKKPRAKVEPVEKPKKKTPRRVVRKKAKKRG